MDESTQEILALLIVAAVVVFEIVRRRRKSKAGKVGCESCPSGKAKANSAEAPLKFHKRKPH